MLLNSSKYPAPTVVFLLFAIILPAIGVCITLWKKPISSQRLPGTQTQLSKYVFFISLIFFLAIQLYGIYFYKLRLMADNASDLISYSAAVPFQTHLPDHYRFTYFLNKVLLLPAFYWHLPMSVAGMIYCFNDAVFYLTIACLILFLTRRYDYAAVVLAMPVVIFGISFYFVDNLFLPAAVMILYLSVYRYTRDGLLRNLILCQCLFLIAWSHPIMLLTLAVFFVGIYKSRGQLLKDKWILLFLVANVLIKFSLTDHYDKERLQSLQGNPDWGLLFRVILEYCIWYWYLVLGLWWIYIADRNNRKWGDYTELLIIPVILYCCAVNHVEIYRNDFHKYVLPLNLLLLTEGALLITGYKGKHKKAVLLFTCIVLLSGLKSTIYNYHSDFVKRVRVLETLSAMCHKDDPGHSKWFVNDDSLHHMASWILNDEAIAYSAIDRLPTTIQLVREKDSLKATVYSTPDDHYYIKVDECFTGRSSLNPYYFHFVNGPYKELRMDSARLSILRKASM